MKIDENCSSGYYFRTQSFLIQYVLNRRRNLKETSDFKLVLGEEMVWLDVIKQHSVEKW